MRLSSTKKSVGFLHTWLLLLGLLVLVGIAGCKDKSPSQPEPDFFQVVKVSANEVTLSTSEIKTDIPVKAVFEIAFSSAADTQQARNSIELIALNSDENVSLDYVFNDGGRQIEVRTQKDLDWNADYQLQITDEMQSAQGATFPGATYDFKTENGQIQLQSAIVNDKSLATNEVTRDVQYDQVQLEFTFSEELEGNYESYFNLSPTVSSNYQISNDGQTVTMTNTEPLDYYRHYTVEVSGDLSAANGFEFDGYKAKFQTGLNPNHKFPEISEQELLDKVQKETFDYFWEFGHPGSGLARERNTSGDVVTIGGSGFGLMAIVTGMHRGFVSRSEGVDRLQKIVNFLAQADRYHGVWPHWMNGDTGNTVPFSNQDDGADLVETAFLAQGLITVREYLDGSNTTESHLIADINSLLDSIEWDWFTRNDQDVLYWHWSPNHGWAMDMKIKGYNEALIVYILAASSKDYSITADVYHQGWASSGAIENGNTFYGYQLPVGYDYGGPLFFSHYSFLGLDPNGLSDRYANYWTQNRNHTLINRAHSVENPNNFVGYSADSWGLTASDEPGGYGVHEPTHDNGTITPTAALSSMPYTPEESKKAMRHFYYVLGDKLWGEYGFRDAFNPTRGWWADSYLAIDQGPIIVMIENYRSGLLWDLFMAAPEVQAGLNKLDFTTAKTLQQSYN